mmetsp:Transcript_57098/g.66719  ORF Transcript_57098/g.66719 Transcript_57098/m.66719 type:complete len:94 (+) Transcript_57098:221-502(+)
MPKYKGGRPKKRKRGSRFGGKKSIDEHVPDAQNLPSYLDGATNPPPLLPPQQSTKQARAKLTSKKQMSLEDRNLLDQDYAADRRNWRVYRQDN